MNRGNRSQLGPRLFTPPPADEATLTDRQTFALHELRDHPEGMTGEQLGRLVHDYFVPSHSASCPWCGQAGLAILKALKARDMVSLRKGGIWVSVRTVGAVDAHPAAPADGRYDPATSEMPF